MTDISTSESSEPTDTDTDSRDDTALTPPAKSSSAGVADIVFLLDVTGSMQPCINAVKDNIAAFIKTLCTPDANGGNIVRHWRAKVVGYRDYEYDGQNWLEDNPFVETAEALHKQLARLHASGGGDEPASLLDALWVVVHQMEQTDKGAEPEPDKWRYYRSARRFVVAFTDASFPDRLTLPDCEGGDTESVIGEIQTRKIHLYLFAPDMECHHNLAAVQRSEYHPIPCDSDEPSARQRALAEFSRDKEKFEKIIETLGKSISGSASIPITA